MTRKDFERHLPYLRRYARALTGSQAAGDGYVQQVLKLVVEGDMRLVDGLPARLALYRLFQQLWSRCPHSAYYDGDDIGTPVDRYLQRLAVETREALLLTAVEEFSVAETAVILNRTAREVEGDIAAAMEAMDCDMQSRVLIIEDELIIALDLENIVEDLGHIVAGITTTCEDAVRTARRTKPQLILSDVKLADGSSGVDAVERIQQETNVPVIFITAYPEALLTGECMEPVYLVTKPFRRQAVSALIGQALFFHPGRAAKAA